MKSGDVLSAINSINIMKELAEKLDYAIKKNNSKEVDLIKEKIIEIQKGLNKII